MKLISLIMSTAMAGSLLCANAGATEPADTIKAISHPKKVTVTKNKNVTSLTAELDRDADGEGFFIYEVNIDTDSTAATDIYQWDLDLPFYKVEQKRKPNSIKKTITSFSALYFGWRFNYGDKAHIKNCFDIGMRNIIGLSWQRGNHSPVFAIGAGWSLQRILVQDNYCFGKEGDRLVVLPFDENGINPQNRLDISSFHFPVTLRQDFTKNSSLIFGAIINLNTYATAKKRCVREKTEYKETYKGLQQNLFTTDLYACIRISDFGLYATWSPMKLFNRQFGPELKGWAIGIELSPF